MPVAQGRGRNGEFGRSVHCAAADKWSSEARKLSRDTEGHRESNGREVRSMSWSAACSGGELVRNPSGSAELLSREISNYVIQTPRRDFQGTVADYIERAVYGWNSLLIPLLNRGSRRLTSRPRVTGSKVLICFVHFYVARQRSSAASARSLPTKWRLRSLKL